MSSSANQDRSQEAVRLSLKQNTQGESLQTAMSSISKASSFDGLNEQNEAAFNR